MESSRIPHPMRQKSGKIKIQFLIVPVCIKYQVGITIATRYGKPVQSTRTRAGAQDKNPAVIAHEFLHGLGFLHENVRPDIWDYVRYREGESQLTRVNIQEREFSVFA